MYVYVHQLLDEYFSFSLQVISICGACPFLNFKALSIKLVNNWDTPIFIIQGGKDYRVPIGQGQEAFQAAQLKGIKSRFMYFPEENHWVLQPQNGLVWQREFFKWLKETL